MACGRPKPNPPSTKRADLGLAWQARLEAYLTANQLNRSESRNKLLEVLLEEREHFTVPRLVHKVSQKHPEIGAATIYRNLPVLLGAGILRETFTDEEGQKVYEASEEEHHDHIVCLDCQAVFEFHDEGIESAQEKITNQLKFSAVNHRHVIYARCAYLKRRPSGKS